MAILGVMDYANAYATGRANGSGGISGNTQDYLKGLKEKYPNVNITVADFKNAKQEDAYMLGSRGYNNVAISASVIEKMAKDPAAAAKYEKVISDMSRNADRVEKFAKENNDEIFGAGVVIDKNGKVSYWMVGRSKDKIENPGTIYKEKAQKQIKEKRAKKKEEEALKEKRLEKAETVEKLLEKMREKEDVSVKAREDGKGAQLDLTI